MGILIFFLVLIPILIILFVAFGFPLWMLIDCAISQRISPTKKVLWILLLLLVWPIGALFYGLLGTDKRWLKILSGCLCAVVLILMISVFNLGLSLGDSLKKELAASINQSNRLDLSALSEEESGKFKDSLRILYDEAGGKFWQRKTIKAMTLVDLLEIIKKDQSITKDEFENWMAKFKTRDLLDDHALEEYIRQMRIREVTDPKKDVQL